MNNNNAHTDDLRHIRAKLIFNPGSGASADSPVQLLDIIRELQAWNYIPEAFLVEPDCDLAGVVQEALDRGIRLFVVSGGDGTISAVSRTLAGTRATLGIIPTGTQNNIALSLGIPADISTAIAILRNGQRTKIDIGIATHDNIRMPFLEVCSIGLVSTLFSAADDIQHGNLARVGDFLTTLAASPAAEIRLLLDGKEEIRNMGHVVLITNMPYTGFHYKVGSDDSFQDGLLDVLFFADLSKLDLLGYIFQGVGIGKPEDARIQHFHVRKIDIHTDPAMSIMADGFGVGEGHVHIEVKRHGLAVMVPQAVKEILALTGDPAAIASD
jgi:YegS/Rv2252/BmrU family lipid kinase